MTLVAVIALLAVVALSLRLHGALEQNARHRATATRNQQTIVDLKASLWSNRRAFDRRERALLGEIDDMAQRLATHRCQDRAALSDGAREIKDLHKILAILAARSPDCSLVITDAELAQIDRGSTLSVRNDPHGHTVIQVFVPAVLPRAAGMLEA